MKPKISSKLFFWISSQNDHTPITLIFNDDILGKELSFSASVDLNRTAKAAEALYLSNVSAHQCEPVYSAYRHCVHK